MCVYQQSWSSKGQAGVLHASVGKRRRKNQDVVLTPNVRSNKVLSRLQHGVSLQEHHRNGLQCSSDDRWTVVTHTQQILPEITCENSYAALSTNSFSDQTLDLGPISLPTNQSTDALTCCRRHINNCSDSTCSPELQPRWQSGKKALGPGAKGQTALFVNRKNVNGPNDPKSRGLTGCLNL